MQDKRPKWKQANGKSGIELPFKGNRSAMVVTSIKTTLAAAMRTTEQSRRQAASV